MESMEFILDIYVDIFIYYNILIGVVYVQTLLVFLKDSSLWWNLVLGNCAVIFLFVNV